MNTAFLITGSNIGDRAANLQEALRLIKASGCNVIATSQIYETEAWGVSNQDAYYNQTLKIKTEMSAALLITTLLQIETVMGRIRKEKYSARNIDIDILFFNNDIINEKNLIIPHPRIQDRKFVLTPMAELAPLFIHPILKKTIKKLLMMSQDPLEAKPLQQKYNCE